MDKIAGIEKTMEKNFRNSTGNDVYYAYNDNFSMNQYSNANGSMPQGRKVSSLNPNARLLSIVLANNTLSVQNITLWTDSSSKAIPNGTTATLAQGSYAGLLNDIIQKPFRIQGLKYSCLVANQFNNAITLGYADNFGTTNSNILTPLAYRSNLQNISTQLDIEDFTFDVGVDSFMTIPVNASERVTLTFFVSSMVQPIRTFTNMPNLAKSPEKFITGLPKQEISVVQR
jgi:hypothetical protein